jgi:hypothetical protein
MSSTPPRWWPKLELANGLGAPGTWRQGDSLMTWSNDQLDCGQCRCVDQERCAYRCAAPQLAQQ